MTPSDERTLEARMATVALPQDPDAAWFAATIRHESLEESTAPTIAVADLPRVSLRMDPNAPQSTASDLSITRLLGEGGMGRIHLARQRSLERDVAVKTLKEGAPHELALALVREARTAGALDHPGVVPVHALGVDAHGQPFLVMKRVEGADFAELLADENHPLWAGRLGKSTDRLAAKLEIMLQVAYASDVPSQLADLRNRATRRASEERPKSAEEFRDAILEFMQNRAALTLSDAARERLTAFGALMAGAVPNEPPTDLPAAYRLVTEARFGFAQCARSYPAHEEASAGARESVVALVDLELRQGHIDSAVALCAELDPPDPAVTKRIDEARARIAAAKREASRLEALGRDVDPNAGLYPRIIGVVIAVFVSAVVGVFAQARVADQHDPWALVWMELVIIGFTIAFAFIMRKWAFKSAFNRRLGAFFLSALFFWLIDRVACALTQGVVEDALRTDLWIMAASLSAGAITVERRLAVSAIPFVAAAVATRVWPARSGPLFGAAMLSSMVFFAVALVVQSRASAKRT